MSREHRLLGLVDGVDAEAVCHGFRRQARRHHPDVDPTPGAGARMRSLIEARTRLLERLTIHGPTRRSITVAEVADRVVAPAVGRPDPGLAAAIAQLLNADPEAGVWVLDADD